MSSEKNCPSENPRLTRIERVLDYIHSHLDEPLSVAQLAEKSCWSRWQLQRVFHSETGHNVAQYVRELKLSMAAEQLLTSRRRMVDIALECGFNSEVSFNRAFKQMFQCAPGAYKKRGQRTGLRTPLKATLPLPQALAVKKRLLQIRVETRPEFCIEGVSGQIQGLFSPQPDYSHSVPTIWAQLQNRTDSNIPTGQPAIGVIDTRQPAHDASYLPYWAGFETLTPLRNSALPPLEMLTVPAQEYAVIPHVGPIRALDQTLHWFIAGWLPESRYRGVDGFELEIYPPGFEAGSDNAAMEYWLPITPASLR